MKLGIRGSGAKKKRLRKKYAKAVIEAGHMEIKVRGFYELKVPLKVSLYDFGLTS